MTSSAIVSGLVVLPPPFPCPMAAGLVVMGGCKDIRGLICHCCRGVSLRLHVAWVVVSYRCFRMQLSDQKRINRPIGWIRMEFGNSPMLVGG